MLPDSVLFQSLRRIELIDPWRGADGVTGTAGASLLAGAIVLHFEQVSAVCTSPLRYSRCQRGTAVEWLGQGRWSDLGYRFTLLAADEAACWALPSRLHRQTIMAGSWLTPACDDAPEPPLLLSTGHTQYGIHTALRLRLLRGGWHELTYRPDLDGCIEFAPEGLHFDTKEPIAVSGPDVEFGWLHPASPYPFALDDRCWRCADPRDWPMPLQRAWRSQPTGELYRETMRRALLARFSQHDRLRERLFALRREVAVAGVPSGLIEEVSAVLQALHGKRAGGVAQ